MRFTLAITALIFSVFLLSCKEDVPEFKESLQSLDNYTNRFKKPMESVRFLNSNGLNYTTRRGNLITIPSDAFLYRNGSQVLGEVTLKVREIFTKTEMFGSGVFPVTADNEPLISGGQVCFEASQNGAKLLVADGEKVSFEFTASNSNSQTPMQLFVSEGEIEEDSVAWEVLNSSDSSFANMFVSQIAGNNVYTIETDSLVWYNCDAFWGLTTHEIVFKLEGIVDTSDFQSTVYGFVSDENSALQTYGPLLVNGEVLHAAALIEEEFSMLAIALQDGELYYDLQTITPTQADTITMELEKILSIDLDEIIEGL